MMPARQQLLSVSDTPVTRVSTVDMQVVFAWGVNEDGQLGVEDKSNVNTPKVVEAFLGIRLAGRSFCRSPIVGGSRNTLAIDCDGQVWSWGWNDRGTLGLGHRQPVSKPQRLTALEGIRIVQIAVNGWHCLALSNTGQMYAWGGNEYLQCGVAPEKRDVMLPTPCLPHLKVVQVACGGMHSLALTGEGTVWTWGEPWGDFSLNVERRPRPVPGAVGMCAIAAGAFHNMALSHTGEVYTWGTNDYGQLGNGHTTYNTEPCRVLDMEGVKVADIAAGGWHSLALTNVGEVYTWGRGEYGRLGTGDTSGSSKLRPHKVRGLDGHCIVQVVAGGTHTMALTSEGRLFIWGRASFGRLGLGPPRGKEVDAYSPVEVTLPGGTPRWMVYAIAAGGRHSLCLALPVHTRPDGSSTASEGGGGMSEEADGGSEASLRHRDVWDPQVKPGQAGHQPGSPGARGGRGPPVSSFITQPVNPAVMAALQDTSHQLAWTNPLASDGPYTLLTSVGIHAPQGDLTCTPVLTHDDLQLPNPPTRVLTSPMATSAGSRSGLRSSNSPRYADQLAPSRSTSGPLRPSAELAAGLHPAGSSAHSDLGSSSREFDVTSVQGVQGSLSKAASGSDAVAQGLGSEAAAPGQFVVHELSTLPSIDLSVGTRTASQEPLTRQVSAATPSLTVMPPLPSVGSPTRAGRPASAGSTGSRHRSGSLGSPSRVSPRARASPGAQAAILRAGSAEPASETHDSDWTTDREVAAGIPVWPDAGADMHTLVAMSLEDDEAGEQRKAEAKARRRAARMERERHSIDDHSVKDSQPWSLSRGADSTSPATDDDEDDAHDDEDEDDGLTHVSSTSRVSFIAVQDVHERSLSRPVSPSHAYLTRGLLATGSMGPVGSPTTSQVQASLAAGMMSPMRGLSGSPHELAAIDVAARLAAAVVGSPRHSTIPNTPSFHDMLGIHNRAPSPSLLQPSISVSSRPSTPIPSTHSAPPSGQATYSPVSSAGGAPSTPLPTANKFPSAQASPGAAPVAPASPFSNSPSSNPAAEPASKLDAPMTMPLPSISSAAASGPIPAPGSIRSVSSSSSSRSKAGVGRRGSTAVETAARLSAEVVAVPGEAGQEAVDEHGDDEVHDALMASLGPPPIK